MRTTVEQFREEARKLRAQAEELEFKAEELEARPTGVIDHTVYVHNSKDSNWETWQELGLPDNDAARRFAYCAYEVGFATKLDTDTGRCVAYGVLDGKEVVKLEREVELT